ncbi:MAG: DUF4010 domain-containing protein [Alphaproteobacteria bacterium]|nr:DUF4010 domain-containing protein [Alphaproteobacteria bacterium]
MEEETDGKILFYSTAINPQNLLLLLGLSFFFGLAYEDLYGRSQFHHPGGVRTFPMLSMSGVCLYLLEPQYGLVFAAGLIILGLWLLAYYQYHLRHSARNEESAGGLVALVCNLLAYLLGPIAVLQSSWFAVGLTVSSVLFLGARDRLHDIARKVPTDEITSTGKFLILTGIILPLLPNTPVTSFTPITPYQVWLAVVVVSGISYASYLIQRYKSEHGGIWLTSVLGGIYSSTITTVVLSRHAQQKRINEEMLHFSIILSTSMVYIRLFVIILAFNLSVAREMSSVLLGLFTLSLFLSLILYRRTQSKKDAPEKVEITQKNPLDLVAAFIFAFLFVVISLASAWAKQNFGDIGLYTLATIIGVSDISPFVVSLAQDSVSGINTRVVANAILIATSSNNVLKAAYTVIFVGLRSSLLPVLLLIALAILGCIQPLWDLWG